MAMTLDNFVRSVLATDATAADIQLVLAKAAPPLRDPPAATPTAPGVLVLQDAPAAPAKIEIVRYTGRNIVGNQVTLTGVTRAQEGTTAQSWTAGTPTLQGITAGVIAQKMDIGDTAAAATKLATPRTFSLTGVVNATGVPFDGTLDLALNTTIPDNALTFAMVSGLQTALDSKLSRAGGTMTGALKLDRPDPSTANAIFGLTAGINRWAVLLGDSNAASAFAVARYNDAGAWLGNPLTIDRATGVTTIASLAAGAIAATGSLVASNGYQFAGAQHLLYSADANNVGVRASNGVTGAFYTFGNDGTFRSLNGGGAFAGAVTATSLNAFLGPVGTQQIFRNLGWANGVPRWKEVIEADIDYALYAYDANGLSPRRMLTIDWATGTTTAFDFVATSDPRLKDKIRPLLRGMNALKRMRPREYVKYGNPEFCGPGKPEVGFLATEVGAVLPEAKVQGRDGFDGVSYGQVTALIASALLEADERIARLEGR